MIFPVRANWFRLIIAPHSHCSVLQSGEMVSAEDGTLPVTMVSPGKPSSERDEFLTSEPHSCISTDSHTGTFRVGCRVRDGASVNILINRLQHGAN